MTVPGGVCCRSPVLGWGREGTCTGDICGTPYVLARGHTCSPGAACTLDLRVWKGGECRRHGRAGPPPPSAGRLITHIVTTCRRQHTLSRCHSQGRGGDVRLCERTGADATQAVAALMAPPDAFRGHRAAGRALQESPRQPGGSPEGHGRFHIATLFQNKISGQFMGKPNFLLVTNLNNELHPSLII